MTPKKTLPDFAYVDVTAAVELGALCKVKLETILKRRDLNAQDMDDLLNAYGNLVALIEPLRRVQDKNEGITNGDGKSK